MAKTAEMVSTWYDLGFGRDLHLLSGAKTMTCENDGTSNSVIAGDTSFGDLNVKLYPRSIMSQQNVIP